MKIYAKSIWCLSIITTISLIILLYYFDCKQVYDICLAIFGSSLVSLIISIIGYRCSKRKALEVFYLSIYKRIVYYNTYIQSWSIKDKCGYFINHYLKDFPSIGEAYAEIYFFFDFKNNNKKYIYNNIYCKCKEMMDTIDSYYLNFQLYINKTGENTKTIERYIELLENKLFLYDGINAKSNFSDEIMSELNGKFFKIVYGHNYKDIFT